MGTDNQKSVRKSTPRTAEWPGPGPLPPIPDANFGVYMWDVLAEYGNEVAMTDAETGEQRTFSFIYENIPRVAGGLRSAGVAQGDVVLLMTPNHIDYPLVLMAVMYCGATFVPINPYLTPEELCHVMRQSNTQWVVSHPSKLKNVEEAMSLLPSGTVRQVWVMGDDIQKRPTLSSLMSSSPISPVTPDNGLNSRQSVAMILFSSGTTGLPKGVMLSHSNLLWTQAMTRYALGLAGDQAEMIKAVYRNTLVMVPMCHLYGYMLVVFILAMGGGLVSLSKFTPKIFFETIEKFKITLVPLVPHIAKFLTTTPLLEKYDTSSVMVFSYATAPLGADSVNAFMEKTGRPMSTSYGLTESGGGICASGSIYGVKEGSVGRVLPYVKVKVIDVENGEMLGENEEGEVCVQGPGVMLGYANNPKATEEMLEKDGWLHTGDLGYFDEENFIFITDRLKDLIKVKGFQVSPAEIEIVLQGHEGVSEVAVVGVPHERTGEAPRAYVVPVPGAHPQPKQLQQYVAERLTPYKQVTGGVVLVEFLPRNHMGKVLRRQLKQDFITNKSKL